MIIKLSDEEIRKALVEYISKKLDCVVIDIPVYNCWFEAKNEVEDGETETSTTDVQFCVDIYLPK